MKLENYEFIKNWCVPNYWYEEGKPREEYWVDSQNLFYHKFYQDFYDLGLVDDDGNPIKDENGEDKKDPRKWWLISPYKPKGVTITEENEDLIKWLVEESYLDSEEKDYEFYEWDFENHCIKED